MQMPTQQRLLATAEVAKRAGIHRDTLLRWLRQGLVVEPQRDRKGWRVFTEREAESIERFAQRLSGGRDSSDIPAEVERLRSIDWDFSTAKTTYLTHGLHPYPAKFIPQIPNALIQELSSVGDTVADIFCGSGTTLLEALVLKRNAVGIDANPLACLISQAKTTVISEADRAELIELCQLTRSLADQLLLNQESTLFPAEPFVSKAWRPDSDWLRFWFDHDVIEEMAECLQFCNQLQNSASKNLALTVFSSIVVNVSRQDSDTRYVRRDKKIVAGDVFRRFSRTLEQAIMAALELADILEPRFNCRLVCSNLLAKPDVGSVDLVVCSPPYPNAYSYHLYHMSRMVWLGMDQPRFKKEEIGSHRKYSSKSTNGATADTFRGEFRQIFSWLRTTLKNGRYACFIVGNSRIRGEVIDNAELIAEAGAEEGFSEVACLSRELLAAKKSFNPAIGKIKTEKVLIVKNDNV